MNKLENNYTNFNALDIAPGQKYIALRTSPTQGEEPLTWQQFDYNFELLRYTLNEVIDEFSVVRSEFTYDEEITSIQNQVTAIQSDLSSNYYTKTESDTAFQPLGDYALSSDIVDSYTKDESDAKYALIANITPHTDAYTKIESDAKYAPIGSTGGGGSLPSGYVLADDFCVGDGVTDDTANLQAAIDSLGEMGGTVLLGNKEYLLASNDGTMPWDLIPDYINTDQVQRGNAPDGSLDGTEDHTHITFRLYAWFRDSVTDDAAGFLYLVGTWNGTEFSGGADSAGFNYWASSGRAALSLWQGLYQAEYEGSDKDTRHVIVREHVTIRGCQESVGAGIWRGDNIGAAVDPKGSTIKIENNTTLVMKRDTALTNLTVVSNGLDGLASSFSGYGVRPSADDVLIQNCFIGGFEYGIYANWTNPDKYSKGNNFGTGGRLRVTSCNMDNTNCIQVKGSYDITYIDKVHCWPFLTGNPMSNINQSIGWDWTWFNCRDGIAFDLSEVNDWTKITDSFSYGYRIGFHVRGSRSVILSGCGADNASYGMTTTLFNNLLNHSSQEYKDHFTPIIEQHYADREAGINNYNVMPGSIGFKITRNWGNPDPFYGDYNAQFGVDYNKNGYIDDGTPFVNAGEFVVGVEYTIWEVGTTDWLAIGATSSTQGTTFTATGPGSGDGVAYSRNEKFYPGTGSIMLTNCQAAAQEIAYTFDLHANECARMSASSSWYCGTHILASATAFISVVNQLLDQSGYIDPSTGLGSIGIETRDSANIMVTNVQFREINNNYLFSNKTLGSNITITGQQDV